MLPFEIICELPHGVRADFAIGVNDDECSPYIERGGLAYISRGGALYDGDVGLFMLSRGVFIRQYCEDWAGNSHFLTLNRAPAPSGHDDTRRCPALGLPHRPCREPWPHTPAGEIKKLRPRRAASLTFSRRGTP